MIEPAVPVVTVGVEPDEPDELTVNEAVAVVLLSVMVSVHAVQPTVNVALADVLDAMVAAPRLSPVQPLPLTLKSVLVV